MDNDKAAQVSLSDRFSRAAQWTSQQCGRAHTFIAAIVLIIAWAVCGPAFQPRFWRVLREFRSDIE